MEISFVIVKYTVPKITFQDFQPFDFIQYNLIADSVLR